MENNVGNISPAQTASPLPNGSHHGPGKAPLPAPGPSSPSIAPSIISSNGISVASNRGSIAGSERSQSSSYRQVSKVAVVDSFYMYIDKYIYIYVYTCMRIPRPTPREFLKSGGDPVLSSSSDP